MIKAFQEKQGVLGRDQGLFCQCCFKTAWYTSQTSLFEDLEKEWNKTPATVEEFLPDWTSGCGNYRCSVVDGEVEHTQTVHLLHSPKANSGERHLTEIYLDRMNSHSYFGIV